MIQMLTQLRYTMISFRFNMCICTSVYKRPSKNEALAEIFMNDLVNDAKVRVNEVLRKSPQERQYKRWKWNPKSANYLLSHFINFFFVLFFVPINWNFTMKLVLSWLQYEEYSSITDSIILSCYLREKTYTSPAFYQLDMSGHAWPDDNFLPSSLGNSIFNYLVRINSSSIDTSYHLELI